jgi:lipoprotein-releasing system permease protein
MHAGDVIRIAAAAMLLTLMATVYPAWKASKTQPAEALRYE